MIDLNKGYQEHLKSNVQLRYEISSKKPSKIVF